MAEKMDKEGGMNQIVLTIRRIVASGAIAIVLTMGCSEEPDKQTSDVDGKIEVVLPDNPCDPAKDLAPIRVKIYPGAGATGAQRYIMVVLTQKSGSNQGTDYCCPYDVYNDVASQIIIRDITPPSYLPEGVYGVKVGTTSNEDAARYCILDSARILVNATDQHYIHGTSSCGPRVQLYYNCQDSYDIRYDKELIRRLNTAFGEAPVYDTLVLRVGATHLSNEEIIDDDRLREFVQSYWLDVFESQFDSVDVCLMAIEDIKRSNFPTIGNAAGFSSGFDFTTVGLGQRGAWSMVFVRYIKTLPYDSKFDKTLLLRCATHELGHARADLSHPSAEPLLHEPGFKCVMDSLGIKVPGTNDPYTTQYNQFCIDCRRNIGLVPWP